ncbi:MAG TPA: hypothetical protein VKH83_05590 [Methylomirabilota bacterium]|nr:hypothetical protein [Methylomirabilota bacterium]
MPSRGLEPKVGTTCRPAAVKQTPTMSAIAACIAKWPMAPKCPALCTVTTPTPTRRALSMASRIAFGPTMMPRRLPASITAVPGDSRSIVQPGRGSSLPAWYSRT